MSISTIENWLDTPQGRYVMNWEQTKIDALVADLFGYNAIQLGMPHCNLLKQSRIPLRQFVGESPKKPSPHSGQVHLLCNFAELPFASNSIDLVIMPHVLEFNANPHQILREVERILIPDGQLILSGFNPISLWGLCRSLSRKKNEFPLNGDYLSVLRLKDWLKLLSFDVDRGHFGCYIPFSEQARWIKRWHFMEAAGDRWWGFAGGVYLLRAIKRVCSMRLIRPKWEPARKAASAVSAVSHKEIKKHEK